MSAELPSAGERRGAGPGEGASVRAWPFVGRDEELRSIAATYREASVSGVVIVGDAGVGMTRLAREALARLAAPGRCAEWVTATRSAAVIPLGAVSHLLPPNCPDDGGLAAFLHAARHFTASGGRRMVLAVDDAHLLDDPSAALVHHLAMRRLAFVLVTVRLGEDTPDAVAALWRENLTVRLDLGPLGSRALDEIVDHTLDGVLDAVSRRELHRICAGNPLLLRELLQAGTETRVLREQAGLWRWTGGLPVTTRLAEVVAARLDTVPDDVGDALEVIACGEPLSLDLLDRLVGPHVAVAAERTGLMVSERSGRRVLVRLAHPLYAEIIRARLAPARVRRVWERIAAALADTPMRRRDDHLFTGLAHLRAQRRTDPDLLLTAARRAYARIDLDLAEALARAAREAGGGWQADQLLAEALDRNGRHTEAAGVLPHPPAGDDVEHVRWAVTRARVLYWGFGQAGEAERILSGTAGRPGQGPADATRSWILLFDGRCPDSIRAAEAVLGCDGAEPDSIVPAAAAATIAASLLGRFDHAQTAYERGMDAVRGLSEEPWGTTLLGIAGCLRHLFTGAAHEAWLLADGRFQATAHKSTADKTMGTVAGIWAVYRGIVARFQGNLDLAAAALREAAVLLADSDAYHLLRHCFAELAAVAALCGDAADATGWLDRADDRRREAGRLYEPWAELNRAWAQSATGSPSSATWSRARSAPRWPKPRAPCPTVTATRWTMRRPPSPRSDTACTPPRRPPPRPARTAAPASGAGRSDPRSRPPPSSTPARKPTRHCSTWPTRSPDSPAASGRSSAWPQPAGPPRTSREPSTCRRAPSTTTSAGRTPSSAFPAAAHSPHSLADRKSTRLNSSH